MHKLKIIIITSVILSVVVISGFLYITNKNLEKKINDLSLRNQELTQKIENINNTINSINSSISASLSQYNSIQPEIASIYNNINKLKLTNKDISSKLEDVAEDYNKRNDNINLTDSSKEDMCKQRSSIGYPCK